MALSAQSFLVLLDSADTLNWTGDPSLTLYTTGQLQGAGCIGLQVGTTTVRVWGPTLSQVYDMSDGTGAGTQLFTWVNIVNYYDLAHQYQDGIMMCVEDANGAQACWQTGGKPSTVPEVRAYQGGWQRIGIDISGAGTPNWDNGLVLDKTQIVKTGMAFTFTVASPYAHNVFIDKTELASPIYSADGRGGVLVTGVNTTDGEAWNELYELSEANALGLLVRRNETVYELTMPLQIGDDTGTTETRFVDSGESVYSVAPYRVNSSYVGIYVRSNSTLPTTVILGEKIATAGEPVGTNGIVLGGANGTMAFSIPTTSNGNTQGGMYGLSIPNTTGWGVTDTRGPLEWLNCQFQLSGSMILSTQVIKDCVFSNGTVTSFGVVRYTANSDGGTFVRNKFINNAVAMSFDSAGTYTLDAIEFYGNTTDILNRSTGTVVLNCINGSNPDPLKVSNPNGGTVVINNSVNVQVHCYRVSYGATATASPVDGVTILLAADAGGPLPYRVAVSITNDGAGTATVTHNAHGFSTGDYVIIRDADQPEYTGLKQITVVDANTYTYSITGTPASPATGSPNATAVVLYGVTDANGDVTGTLNYTSDQPVVGTARKTSTAPLYKIAPISGTVTINGFRADIAMVPDDS